MKCFTLRNFNTRGGTFNHNFCTKVREMVNRGRKAGSSASWYVAAQFLIAVRDELGWDKAEINLLVERLVGAEFVGRGSRFFWRVVDRGQEAAFSRPSLPFQTVMKLLYEYPAFSAQALRWYRPVFHLVDSLAVKKPALPRKTPKVRTPGIQNIAICLDDALEDSSLSRMTLDDVTAAYFTLGLGPLSSALGLVVGPDRIRAGFKHSLASMTKDVSCPFKQLNLVALLSLEAASVSDFRIHGYLREFSQSIWDACSSSDFLNRAHLRTFQRAYETEVFERPRSFKQTRAEMERRRTVVGSPLLTAEERIDYERWRNNAFKHYLELVRRSKEGPPLFCWSQSWRRGFQKYLERRGLDCEAELYRCRSSAFQQGGQVIEALVSDEMFPYQ
jgi:hypothetical protein